MKAKYISTHIVASVCTAVILCCFTSCKDFEALNKDPNAVLGTDANPLWALNQSMVEAQMNPHIGERIFGIYWMRAARYQGGSGINTGGYDDSYNSDYFSGYINNWLNAAHTAITLADEKIAAQAFKSDYEETLTLNVREFARIWYCYLLSELTDNFGPAPINGFQGNKPSYASEKEVYAYLLAELKDAITKINPEVTPNEEDKKVEKAYGLDAKKWVKYARSLQMRLAMRMSAMDLEQGKTAFEDAVKDTYIAELDDSFQVLEMSGWNPLAGVMSRSWNVFPISKTMINLMVGLGGIPANQLWKEDAEALKNIKPKGYWGTTFPAQYPKHTNDPTNGLYMDGIPYCADPRLYAIYDLPGTPDNFFLEDYQELFAKDKMAYMMERKNINGKDSVLKYRPVPVGYTVNSYTLGNWDGKEALNAITSSSLWAKVPVIKRKYRNEEGKRLFFGPWESYFLIAEAALKGWNTPIPAKEAYEKGVRLSLEYHNCAQYADAYLASKDYSNVGTSVAWDHTEEPPATIQVDVTDGETGKLVKYTYKYPVAALTRYGKALNDHMTKVITQKYLAQCPYLCLEAWSDYRRTGLPFFETPAADSSIPTMTHLTPNKVTEQQTYNLFPQRLRYPSTFQNSNPEGYKQALDYIGGTNEIFTPLAWAKK